jgi:purine-binding chemotaxis protein CheW
MRNNSREEEQIESQFNLQKVLWFTLGYEDYAIRVDNVTTVIDEAPLTPIPSTPRFVRGVINLRGSLIPVIDLKEMFQMRDDRASQTMMIIMEIGAMRVGIIVDKVNEVLDIDFSTLLSTPPSVSGFGTEYILGIFKLPNRNLIIVDIEKVLNIAREMINKYS